MNVLQVPVLQFFDNSGVPVAGGSVFTYAADGATPKATWQDLAGSIVNANPVALDASGRAVIWGSGAYVWNLQDALGNTIWTKPTQDLTQSLATMLAGPTAPTTATSGVSSLAGVWWHDTGTNTVWVRDQADTTWIPTGFINEVTKTYTPDINSIANLALTGFPTAPTQTTGDNTTLIATDAFVQATLAQSPALGGVPTAPTAPSGASSNQIATTAFVAQNAGFSGVYNNIGLRAINTTYTNTTNRPMFVNVSGYHPSNNQNISLLINGMQVAFSGESYSGINLWVGGMVPSGATYRINADAGTVVSNWVEVY